METYWQIGEYIVEFEQGGSAKSEYGQQLLKILSQDLKSRLGKGFSRSNLVYMRQWPPIVQLPEQIRTHYRILVSGSVNRPRASLYAFNLQEPIPAFPLPLREGESEPIINLQGLLGDIYDQSGYDLVIDYNEEPVPPLEKDDAV